MAHPHDRSGSIGEPAHRNDLGTAHPINYEKDRLETRLPSIGHASPGRRPIEDAIFSRLHSTGTSDAAQSIQLDLLWKFSRGDWHGVSDAANDLRVLEAQEAK